MGLIGIDALKNLEAEIDFNSDRIITPFPEKKTIQRVNSAKVVYEVKPSVGKPQKYIIKHRE